MRPGLRPAGHARSKSNGHRVFFGYTVAAPRKKIGALLSEAGMLAALPAGKGPQSLWRILPKVRSGQFAVGGGADGGAIVAAGTGLEAGRSAK